MTTNERFLSVLHRITSCRHLATVNITIWNRRIEVRHTVFDEMYILRSFPLPNTHNEYCACMAAACRCLSDKLLSWASEVRPRQRRSEQAVRHCEQSLSQALRGTRMTRAPVPCRGIL